MPKCPKTRINFFKLVLQQYADEVDLSITAMFQFFQLSCVPNIIEIGQRL